MCAEVRRAWLALVFVIGLAAPGYATCDSSPRFRVGQVWEDSPSTLLMAVSIAPGDFAPSRMLCLAARLKERYRTRAKLDVMIFSSHDAAARYSVVQIETDTTDPNLARLSSHHWQVSQLHGIYSFTANGPEYLDIKPWGSDADQPYDTRISLPAVAPVHCKLEIGGRCLLALSDLVYPRAPYDAKASGTITLSGSITARGDVTNVRVDESTGSPSDLVEPLIREAVENLKSWRFEAARRPAAFRISYEYLVDPSLGYGHSRVDFALPERVMIRTNPPD
jgi:TonB family protein